MNKTLEDFMSSLIGSHDAYGASLGRLIATNVVDQVHGWVDDEVARGTKLTDIARGIVTVIGMLNVDLIMRSIPGHEAKVVDLLSEGIRHELEQVAKASIAMKAGK